MLLEKYEAIWTNVEVLKNVKLHALSVYDHTAIRLLLIFVVEMFRKMS